MENQENIIAEAAQPRILELDYVRDMLGTTAKWAKFMAIIGFIATGFMVLVGLIMMVVGNSLPTQDVGLMKMISGTFLGAIYLAVAAFYFFPSRYLYQYSDKLTLATHTKDETQLVLALDKNKSYFKFIGIATIVGVAFYLLFLIALVVIMAAGGDFVTGG